MTENDLRERPCTDPRIAICTALPEELAACRLVIDELAALNPDHPDDGNQYWCGTLPSRADGERHRVLLTSLVKMGNNVAATAVTHLIRSFPSVEYVLMVGIAGGIPHPAKPDQHVRLGDIVVSNEKGVLQYDNVKRSTDEIQIRDNSPKPGARLIGAAKALESDFVLGLLSLDGSLLKAAHLPAFQRPLPDTDRLHNSKKPSVPISHPKDAWRNQNPDRPKIHLGAIGSANELLKDPIRRDRLRDEHGVQAIEMEGSGTADAAWSASRDYLVIRGICDYCDTYKNDDWHHYAALVAAAYARALIESLPDFPPRHRYGQGLAASAQTLGSIADQRLATRGSETDDVKQLRAELGQFSVERLESILELRVRGEIEKAWEKLTEELATLAASGVPEAVQARYFYHAARFAQEDSKPPPQQRRYHQTALNLNPDLDDRTYRAFEAASDGNIELVIKTLRPYDTESVCVNLCRHMFEADRWSDVDELLGDPDGGTTDEVRRMRAICRLADGDFAGAWNMLEPTLGRHQEEPLFALTASYVAFWQAVPQDLHRPGNIGPGLFTSGVFTMDEPGRQRLADSFHFSRKALSFIPAGSKNSLQRDARDAGIAVGTAIPQHHDEAAALAEAALVEDPTAPVPAWALLRMQRDHDWAPTVSALRVICDGPNPETDQIALLADLLLTLNKPDVAWHYLERIESRSGTPDENRHWFERAIRCLDHLGRLSDLDARLLDLSNSPEDMRLRAAYWSARNEPEKVREIAEALVDAPGTLLDHVNLVSLHRSQMEWLELTFSARCCLTQFPDISAQVIDALAMAWLELDKPSEALAVLVGYRDAYERDGLLDVFFFRTMSAHGVLGHYDEAFDASESLWQRRPYADLVGRRAHLQFLLGDTPRAVEILKRGIQDGFDTPANVISVAHLLLMSNREEAFLSARKAVERYPDDPQVRVNAMDIAFNSGHGDWAAMQLAFLTQRYPDSGLFIEASPPMLLKLVLEGQERSAANWERFTAGQIPIHIWADSSNRGLGAEFYWRWYHNRNRPAAEHVSLPTSYGGRPAKTGFSTWTGRVVKMDYTACLAAHLLKLFPALDSALDRISIPPSLFAVIQREIQELAKDQTDHIERAEHLLSLLEGERATVTLLPPPDVVHGEFLALQPIDRQEWRLAEDHGLRIVTDKFATEMFEEGEIPEALATLRVTPRSVIGTLRSAGELLDDASQGSATPQFSAPGDRCDLPLGARLLVDQAFLDELLIINGYEAATSNFSLYCMDTIRDELRSDIQGHRYRQKVKVWLEGMLEELKRLRAKGSLMMLTLPTRITDDKSHQPLIRELRELLSGSEHRGEPVWIDDRTLSSYTRNGGDSQIINIQDILGNLRARNAITPGKYLQCHRELIQAGMVFRVPAPDYLYAELQTAKIDSQTDSLIENRPLSHLRQSVTARISAGSSIGTMPLREGMLAERDQFITELRRLIDEVMAMIWTKEGIDDSNRGAIANWLYYNFFPNDARVTTDAAYRNDLVQGLAIEHSARISLFTLFLGQPSAIKMYYSWLFVDLEVAWRNQNELAQKVFDHYARLIIGAVRELSRTDSNRNRLARFVDPVRFLPKEMMTALLEHPKLEPMLRPFFRWGTYLDPLDLFVPEAVWTDTSNSCIAQNCDEPYIATVESRQMEIAFLRRQGIGDAFVVSGATATGRQSEQTILSPFARLDHPAVAQRLAWLDDVIDARLLQADSSNEWRERLGSDKYAQAAEALRTSCLRSPPYFFGTAALALGIPNLSSEHWDLVLPEYWDVLDADAYSDALESGALENRMGASEESPRLKFGIAELAALPFGPPGDLATHLAEILKEGGVQTESIERLIRALRQGSRNPITLANLLASVLANPQLRDDLSAPDLVRELLTPQPGGLYDKAFNTYTELLRLIWNHFRLNTTFSEESYRRRIRGAYIYADRLLDAMVREDAANAGYLDVAAETIRDMNASLSKRINPLTRREDGDADVACPAIASRWRTVVGATLRILERGNLVPDDSASAVLETFENLLPMMDPFSDSTPFELEPLELFDLPPNPDNSPINNQGRSIALDLKMLLSGSEASASDGPTDFSTTVWEKPNPQVLAGLVLILSRYPIPEEFCDRAAGFVDSVIEGQLLQQETKLSFRAVASVLPRLPGDFVAVRRERLFQLAFEGVRMDANLWRDVCEMSFQLGRLGEPEDRIRAFLDTLDHLAPLIPQESKDYGEFVAFARQIEALIPACHWPRLWSAGRAATGGDV